MKEISFRNLILKLWKKLITNIDVKLLSLGLAFLLWIVVMNISDPVETKEFKEIPVRVTNEDAISDAEKIYTIVSGKTVDITVEGPQSIVRELGTSSFTAIADLSKTSPVGAVIIDVKAPARYEEQLTITTGKRNDAVMIISLEDRITDTFRVNVRTQGTPLTNYYVMPGYEAFPKMVEVSGAASNVNAIKEVIAEVSVQWKSSSFSAKTELKAYDNYGYEVEGIEFDVKDVDVSIRVVPTKEIAVNVVPRGMAAEGYVVESIKNEPDVIVIAGEKDALEKWDTLVPEFNISGLGSGESNVVEAEIDLQEVYGDQFAKDGIVFVNDDTKISVRVTFKEEPKQRVSLTARDIEIRNVPEGYIATINMEGAYTKSLEIAGYSGKILASDLRAYVDLAGGSYSEPGTYQAEVYIDPVIQGITKKSDLKILIQIEETPPIDPIEPVDPNGTGEPVDLDSAVP